MISTRIFGKSKCDIINICLFFFKPYQKNNNTVLSLTSYESQSDAVNSDMGRFSSCSNFKISSLVRWFLNLRYSISNWNFSCFAECSGKLWESLSVLGRFLVAAMNCVLLYRIIKIKNCFTVITAVFHVFCWISRCIRNSSVEVIWRGY